MSKQKKKCAHQMQYLGLELQDLGNPGRWTSIEGGNVVLGNISDALVTAMPEEFPRPDKTAGRRVARLMWLSDMVGRKLDSSKQLYPVEAIRIRNWLEGLNLVTGEDEEGQTALIVERLAEVEAWIKTHWETIRNEAITRKCRRVSQKKSSAPCAKSV